MPYELFYHPGFTGRIEPVLLLLHDAGIAYELSRAPCSGEQVEAGHLGGSLVGLSPAMAGDAAFARQARRKYL